MSEASSAAAINQDMVSRLLAEPADPPTEGEFTLRVLQTRGRRSHHPRRTPLAVVRHGHRDHLVSPDPRRDWVRNLRAHPSAQLLSMHTSIEVATVELDADPGAAVVATYLRAITVPWALRAFPVPVDASLDEITAHMDTLVVFELDHQPGITLT